VVNSLKLSPQSFQLLTISKIKLELKV